MKQVTQQDFERLSCLVTFRVFKEFTGLGRDEIRSMVQRKDLEVWRATPSGYAKFYKSDIARIAKFKL